MKQQTSGRSSTQSQVDAQYKTTKIQKFVKNVSGSDHPRRYDFRSNEILVSSGTNSRKDLVGEASGFDSRVGLADYSVEGDTTYLNKSVETENYALDSKSSEFRKNLLITRESHVSNQRLPSSEQQKCTNDHPLTSPQLKNRSTPQPEASSQAKAN